LYANSAILSLKKEYTYIHEEFKEDTKEDTHEKMKNYLHESAREGKLKLFQLKILCRFY